jgi:hypothetical protein
MHSKLTHDGVVLKVLLLLLLLRLGYQRWACVFPVLLGREGGLGGGKQQNLHLEASYGALGGNTTVYQMSHVCMDGCMLILSTMKHKDLDPASMV